MKKLIFLGAIVLSFQTHAQLGVVTIKPKDYMPLDQWFQVKRKKYKNWVHFYSEKEVCLDLLKRELEPYGLTFSDGELQDDGSLLWHLNHTNGFGSMVFYEDKGEYVLILIYSYPIKEG